MASIVSRDSCWGPLPPAPVASSRAALPADDSQDGVLDGVAAAPSVPASMEPPSERAAGGKRRRSSQDVPSSSTATPPGSPRHSTEDMAPGAVPAAHALPACAPPVF